MTKNKNITALLLAIIIDIFGCGQEEEKNFFTPPNQNSDCELSINISCASLISSLIPTQSFHCYISTNHQYSYFVRPQRIYQDNSECLIDVDLEIYSNQNRKSINIRGAKLTSIFESYTVGKINEKIQWFQDFGRCIKFSHDGYDFHCYRLSGAGAGIYPPANEWVIPNNCPNYN